MATRETGEHRLIGADAEPGGTHDDALAGRRLADLLEEQPPGLPGRHGGQIA